MSSLDSSVHQILELLVPKFQAHKQQNPHPIVLGISGLQGSGKSTWAGKIVDQLLSQYGLHAITVSLDDFYHSHDNITSRRNQDPENKFYRGRGQPGTHDQKLAQDTLQALRFWDDTNAHGVEIPVFDKSCYNGEGDRAPREAWPHYVTKPDVVVFEGWCVGFRALSDSTLRSKYQGAKEAPADDNPECIVTLPDHDFAHVQEVNHYLAQYNETFMGAQNFDFLVHLDTEDLRNVYRWRLQQEHAMWKVKGAGMSDDSVRDFVRGYMPAYELYLQDLREGFFGSASDRHVRVTMDWDRSVEKVQVI